MGETVAKGRQRPLAKFLCIKGVVFFAFWQGLVLEGLAWAGVLHAGHFWAVSHKVTALQDALVCLEMVFFAAVAVYAFPSGDYRDAKLAAKKTQ